MNYVVMCDVDVRGGKRKRGLATSEVFTDPAKARQYAATVAQSRNVEVFESNPLKTFATPELITAARNLYCDSACDIEVDDFEVASSEADDGTWVAGWLWVPKEL